MTDHAGEAILNAACFRMGVFGARLTREFSGRIEQIGLSHKQVGLLAVVGAGLAQSQREIASQLHVAPSLVVSLVDQLIELGAVTRSRSTSDRRVQVIELTEQGRELLRVSASAAQELDAEVRAGLSQHGQLALDTLLRDLDARNPIIETPPGASA